MARPDYIIIDTLNIKRRNHWKKIKNVLEKNYPDLVEKWDHVLFYENDYYEKLKQRLIKLFKKYEIKYEFCF